MSRLLQRRKTQKEFGCGWHKNLPEHEEQRLVEYRKNVKCGIIKPLCK